jgi:hypothetical protein
MFMEFRQLGGSGLKVPVLSLGTGTFGGSNEFFRGWGASGVPEATRLVDVSLEAGMNMFDSADIYSDGLAEEILGHAIKGRRDKVIVSTKATFRMGSGPNDVWVLGREGHVARSIGDGNGFQIVATLSEGHGIGGSGPDDVWIFARSPTILQSNATHYDGTFTPYVTLEDPLLFDRVDNALIAIDRSGNVWDDVDGAWTVRPLNGTQTLSSAFLVSPNEAYGVIQGRIARYNGVSWAFEDIPQTFGFATGAIGGTPTDLFAVGNGGGVLRK